MRAIAGLGNPDPIHVATRHNLGFWVIERLLRQRRWKRRRFPWGEVATRPEGCLLRPVTYMNRSGEALKALVERHGIAPEELLVVVDDVDLPVGAVRLRPKGGAGTHNGLRSVIAALGTDHIPRLKVGVGAPPPGSDLAGYVLSPPEGEEVPPLEKAADFAAELALVFLDSGLPSALDSYARAQLPL